MHVDVGAAHWIGILLLVALLLDIAAVVVALRLWRSRQKLSMAKPWLPLIVPSALLTVFLLGLCGTTIGLIKAFGAVGGESVDPSQKARIMAEGISEAMNFTAFGVLALLPVSIGFLIYAAVVRRRVAR
jgi:hypothetical protein